MSSSRNGADIGQVLAIVQDLAAGQKEVRATLQEHSRQLKDLSADVGGLRRQVTEYHSSVLGHGVLISELDQRERRIERHLDLPPAAE